MNTKANLIDLLEGCKKHDRCSQKRLYETFFAYGMSIALRYSKSKDDALEVLNDSFLKVFLHIERYDPAYAFNSWIRKIIVHTAIDHYRSSTAYTARVISMADSFEPGDGTNLDWQHTAERDFLPLIQRLPPAYRTVFNLYVMDGYKHAEIARILNISEGTSKSNLARAKAKLKSWITAPPKNREEKVLKDG
ncbi:MAG: RNA polymerase sigma factor [Bacteroidota bacterium]